MQVNSEIAVLDSFNLAPIDGGEEIAAAIKEEIGILGALDIARATVPTGGTTIFSVKRGSDDDDPELIKTMEGVIIYHHPAYAFWASPFAGAGTQPDCASTDGIEGFVPRTGEIVMCADCPYNKFGSEMRPDGSQGRGKACKNGHRVYLLRDGDYLPILVSLPPTALKPLKKYLQSLIIPAPGRRVRRTHGVITRISLKAAKSGDGITYALPSFELVGDLPQDKVERLLLYAESFKTSMQQIEVFDAPPFEEE